MSVTRDMTDSYRAPGRAFARQLREGVSEARVLSYLMISCFIIFVSQLPRLAREAHLDPSIPLDARAGAAILGWLFFVPLVAYGLSFLLVLVQKVLRMQAHAFTTRMALFWALLVTTPLWILQGLVAGLIGVGPALTAVNVILLAVYLIVLFACLRAAGTYLKESQS
ncbi:MULTISPECIES: YIP1 family protein [Halocynthiibacter]|uniref:YIP1 family protein n=1 Tax=Halocynthiibacter halioticoli TaxID=2986804 RepID=A0AAE3J1K4_9RHOB|nr:MULTISPECIES: YIP1 family protein [Halocynthiibacter]MCV6824446.1 YIP1 family protein [Halocynthiibacter halioticoli]MCW4057447.1 YIP1 family protein [Halocynthiibacter sp. SDUM655004]MDE0589516.1 YIP1 family protein [Halocynthiibacter sp. C4]